MDSLIHSAVTTGPQPLPKRVLHTVRSSVSSFSFQNPRVSSSCLHLLPRLPITSILPSIFPSIMRFKRQLLHKTWPIQLAILLFIVCTIFLSSLTLCNTSSFLTRSVQPISSSTTFQNCPGISDLLSAMSQFQYRSQLRPKCSTYRVLP
jgi:hypothetical protein